MNVHEMYMRTGGAQVSNAAPALVIGKPLRVITQSYLNRPTSPQASQAESIAESRIDF